MTSKLGLKLENLKKHTRYPVYPAGSENLMLANNVC